MFLEYCLLKLIKIFHEYYIFLKFGETTFFEHPVYIFVE